MNTEVNTWRPLTEFEHEELGMRLSCTESFPDLPTDMMVETENGLEVSHFAADFFPAINHKPCHSRILL